MIQSRLWRDWIVRMCLLHSLCLAVKANKLLLAIIEVGTPFMTSFRCEAAAHRAGLPGKDMSF